jgi:hypothetical protein
LASGVGALDPLGCARDLVEERGGRAAALDVVAVLYGQVPANDLLERQRAKRLPLLADLIRDRGRDEGLRP